MSATAEVTQIPTALVDIAREATVRIDALARGILELGPLVEPERDLVARELASRIVQLSTAAWGVLCGDVKDGEQTAELYLEVHQEPMPAAEEVAA